MFWVVADATTSGEQILEIEKNIMEANLIKASRRLNRIMKYISLYSIIILLSCRSTYKTTTQPSPLLFEIHFQDYFKGDSISLQINECLVFENEILYSDSLLGNAYVVIQGYSYDKVKGYRHDSGYEVIFLDKKILCKIKEYSLNINILMNTKEHSFQVDLKKGKFIGFSKKVEGGGLRLMQSVIPFGYD